MYKFVRFFSQDVGVITYRALLHMASPRATTEDVAARLLRSKDSASVRRKLSVRKAYSRGLIALFV